MQHSKKFVVACFISFLPSLSFAAGSVTKLEFIGNLMLSKALFLGMKDTCEDLFPKNYIDEKVKISDDATSVLKEALSKEEKLNIDEVMSDGKLKENMTRIRLD